jgi:regulatory protein
VSSKNIADMLPQAVMKTPGKVTRQSLERAALFRLERRALSVAQLRRALIEKVKRAERVHGPSPQAPEWIDELVVRLLGAGLLDDARVAAGRAAALRDRGMSSRMILMRLKHKGIDTALAEASFARGVEDELAAASAYVRRRRLREKDRAKALAALARQGFSFDVARRALDDQH